MATSIRHVLVAGFVAIIFLFALPSRGELIHRYSFTGDAAGDGLKDSVGKVNAKLYGDAKLADGKLELKNQDKASDDSQLSYLEFTGPILPKSGSVSVVTWFTATADAGSYGRVFNFGAKEDASGHAFFYFTPHNAEDNSRVGITATDAASKTYLDNDRLDDGKPHMVAVVVDGAAKKLHVFIDGKEPKPAEDLGENTLDQVKQVNNWIGRSSFDQDSGLTGSIDEFRVYDNALTADAAAAVFKAGPDELPTTAATPAPTK
jgi:hypothetical protein